MYVIMPMVVLFVLVWTIFFVLLDELVMGTVQRRIGPLAIGFYGLLSAIINGLNLAVAQLRLPKHHFNLGFKWFPIIFFSLSIFGFSMNYPFFFFDNSFSLLVFGFVSFFGVIFLILSAYSGLSKYNILGAMRLISQLLSYELVWSSIIMLFISSYGNALILSHIFNYSFYLGNNNNDNNNSTDGMGSTSVDGNAGTGSLVDVRPARKVPYWSDGQIIKYVRVPCPRQMSDKGPGDDGGNPGDDNVIILFNDSLLLVRKGYIASTIVLERTPSLLYTLNGTSDMSTLNVNTSSELVRVIEYVKGLDSQVAWSQLVLSESHVDVFLDGFSEGGFQDCDDDWETFPTHWSQVDWSRFKDDYGFGSAYGHPADNPYHPYHTLYIEMTLEGSDGSTLFSDGNCNCDGNAGTDGDTGGTAIPSDGGIADVNGGADLLVPSPDSAEAVSPTDGTQTRGGSGGNQSWLLFFVSFSGLVLSLWALIETMSESKFYASGPSPRAPLYFKQYICFWLFLTISTIITFEKFGLSVVCLFGISFSFYWILILILIMVLLVRFASTYSVHVSQGVHRARMPGLSKFLHKIHFLMSSKIKSIYTFTIITLSFVLYFLTAIYFLLWVLFSLGILSTTFFNLFVIGICFFLFFVLLNWYFSDGGDSGGGGNSSWLLKWLWRSIVLGFLSCLLEGTKLVILGLFKLVKVVCEYCTNSTPIWIDTCINILNNNRVWGMLLVDRKSGSVQLASINVTTTARLNSQIHDQGSNFGFALDDRCVFTWIIVIFNAMACSAIIYFVIFVVIPYSPYLACFFIVIYIIGLISLIRTMNYGGGGGNNDNWLIRFMIINMLAFTPVNLFLSSNALLIIDPSSFIGYYYYLSLIFSLYSLDFWFWASCFVSWLIPLSWSSCFVSWLFSLSNVLNWLMFLSWYNIYIIYYICLLIIIVLVVEIINDNYFLLIDDFVNLFYSLFWPLVKFFVFTLRFDVDFSVGFINTHSHVRWTCGRVTERNKGSKYRSLFSLNKINMLLIFSFTLSVVLLGFILNVFSFLPTSLFFSKVFAMLAVCSSSYVSFLYILGFIFFSLQILLFRSIFSSQAKIPEGTLLVFGLVISLGLTEGDFDAELIDAEVKYMKSRRHEFETQGQYEQWIDDRLEIILTAIRLGYINRLNLGSVKAGFSTQNYEAWDPKSCPNTIPGNVGTGKAQWPFIGRGRREFFTLRHKFEGKNLYALYSSYKVSIESSKGIYSTFINSMLPHSSSRAFCVNIVANDFLMITQLNRLCRFHNLADGIALLGSLDFVLGSVDLMDPRQPRSTDPVDLGEINLNDVLLSVFRFIIKCCCLGFFVWVNMVSGCSYVLVIIFITWMFLFIIRLMTTDIYNDFRARRMVFGYKYACGWYAYNIFMIYFVTPISWFLTQIFNFILRCTTGCRVRVRLRWGYSVTEFSFDCGIIPWLNKLLAGYWNTYFGRFVAFFLREFNFLVKNYFYDRSLIKQHPIKFGFSPLSDMVYNVKVLCYYLLKLSWLLVKLGFIFFILIICLLLAIVLWLVRNAR